MAVAILLLFSLSKCNSTFYTPPPTSPQKKPYTNGVLTTLLWKYPQCRDQSEVRLNRKRRWLPVHRLGEVDTICACCTACYQLPNIHTHWKLEPYFSFTFVCNSDTRVNLSPRNFSITTPRKPAAGLEMRATPLDSGPLSKLTFVHSYSQNDIFCVISEV